MMNVKNNNQIFLIFLVCLLQISCSNPRQKQEIANTECFCAKKQFIPKSFIENHNNSSLFTIKCKYYDSGEIKEVNETFFSEKHPDTLLLNQCITYDTSGNMIESKSHYLLLKAEKDTIKRGEKYKLKISLAASDFDSYMAVYVGQFNESFVLLDSNNVDSLYNDTTEILYETNNYTLGKNGIRGIVQDYISYYEDNDTTHIAFDYTYLFFSKSFFVLPR